MSWSDGAHLGVSAERAIESLFGGAPSPGPEEMETREQVRARLMAAPEPLSDPGPDTYGRAADAIARAMLELAEQRPELLASEDLYTEVCDRWPGFDRWARGATEFQVSWAHNCVRWLHELPPQGDPALLEVKVSR